MQVAPNISLTLEFDSGYTVINTDFLSYNLVEKVYALPVLDLRLSITSRESFRLLGKARFINVSYSNDGDNNTSKYKVQIISAKTPDLGLTRTFTIIGLFYDENFILNRSSKSFINKNVSEVLKEMKALQPDIDSSGEPSTYYRMNSSEWEFISKTVTPYAILKEGIPLVGVSSQSKLIFRDTSLDRKSDFKISARGGEGTIGYSLLSMDTRFSKEYFVINRLRSVVKSHYTVSSYEDLKQDNPIIDQPMVIDNGNCADNHAFNPLINAKRFMDAVTVAVKFNHSYDNIKLLDLIDLVGSEDSVTGLFYVVGVETTVGTKASKTIYLKEKRSSDVNS